MSPTVIIAVCTDEIGIARLRAKMKISDLVVDNSPVAFATLVAAESPLSL